MGIIIRNKKDFFIRLPVGIALIAVIGVSPFIIGFIGTWLTELVTGEPCHEGNCFWGVIPWFFFVSFPLAGLMLIGYLGVIIVDTVKIVKK